MQLEAAATLTSMIADERVDQNVILLKGYRPIANVMEKESEEKQLLDTIDACSNPSTAEPLIAI
jgi:hypothetical protein